MGFNLNSFIIILTLVVVKGGDVIPKNAAEEKLLYLLQKWRTSNIESYHFTLPSLDVITVSAKTGTYKENRVKITYEVSEMHLTGVNDFCVVELNVSQSKMEGSGVIKIPVINIFAENYSIDGRAYYVYSLKGSGQMNASFHNIKLMFGLSLGTSGTSTFLDDLQLDFEVESIEANLENSSWPVNKVLNRDGVKILNAYHDYIVDMTKDALYYYLDDYLATVSPQDFFNNNLIGEMNSLDSH